MKKTFFLFAVLALNSNLSYAVAQLKLEGTVYSSSEREIAIQRGSNVYFLNRKAFDPKRQDWLINSKKQITVSIPMTSITRVTSLSKGKSGK